MKTVVDALVGLGLAMSRSDARRQVQQGHVKVDGERVGSIEAVLPAGAHLLRRGREERILSESREDPLLNGILEGDERKL
jgi:tyrosyl-tRNA synthetase